jgi:quercetin dioxygenase-like cupin family protein
MSFLKLSDLDPKNPFSGFSFRIVHTDRMTVAYVTGDADSAVAEHAHPHEQICNVIDGELELTVGGETRVLKQGLVAVIPSNVPHSARALTDCKIIDVFSPVREDLK